jgi:hypothetical protein
MSDDELAKIFMNKFDCYARIDDEELDYITVPAMTEEKFIEVVKSISNKDK